MVKKPPYEIAPILLGDGHLIWGRNIIRAIYSFRDLKSDFEPPSRKDEIRIYFCKFLARAVCNALNLPFALISVLIATNIHSVPDNAVPGLAIILVVIGFLISYSARPYLQKWFSHFFR